MTRLCQDKLWPQCKEQRRNKQARRRRRQRYHRSVGQPTHTWALPQHEIAVLRFYMQGSVLNIDFQLSNPIGIFYVMCIIHYIINKKLKSKLLILYYKPKPKFTDVSLISGILSFLDDSYLLSGHRPRFLPGNIPKLWTVHLWFQIQTLYFEISCAIYVF